MNAPAADRGTRLSFVGAGRSAAGAGPDVLGAKADGLMQMAAAGLPVPAGFVLSTQICADYHGGPLGQDVIALVSQGIQHLEQVTGRKFGGSRRPLLVAVRSGAPVSMPGMLDTILDVGLCDETLAGLVRATGDMRFAWDSYRRLIQSYAEVVERCDPARFTAVVDAALRRADVPEIGELDAAALTGLAAEFQERYRSAAGRLFPQDPMDQLLGAIEAVLQSWNSARAVEYRRLKDLTGLPGTAVLVQTMVFGNAGMTSGAGVGFTRDPATGQRGLCTDFLLNAQGEDVVSGREIVTDSKPLIDTIPGLADELQAVSAKLETAFGDAQDFEFTVEEGKLWLLQTRTAKRTGWAALQIATDLVHERRIDRATAIDRLRSYDLDQIVRCRLAPGRDVTPIGTGTAAGAGVAVGRIALTAEDAEAAVKRREPVILVRPQASTDDIPILAICRGLLTAAGARTSHAAVVARELGVACLVGCPTLVIDRAGGSVRIGGWQGNVDEFLTIDGASGNIYAGALELVEERPTELIDEVRRWQKPDVARTPGGRSVRR